MTKEILKRGMVIIVNLNPTKGSETAKIRPCIIVTNDTYNAKVPIIQVVPLTVWSEKKERIITNIPIVPSPENGLSKHSIADCLQTRPIDIRARLKEIKGKISESDMKRIDEALKIVFQLDA